ncbi:FGGY-family carbohydrate kinase [Streptococcus dentiloxodontae]
MQYFLSIDYGGTNTKAIIFDENGNQLGVSSFATLKIEDKPGFREVDLLETWSAISASIGDVIEKTGVKASAINAVACIGHGKGLYVLDKNGQEFTRGILSVDSRAAQLAESFEERLDDIWPLTQQHVVGVQNPVLLRWLKDNNRAVYDQIGSVLSAKDYVRYKLTGQINQEYGDASGNHWINFQTGTYDNRILDFFGIAEIKAALPPLVDCAEIVGRVSEQAAQQTGLAAGTPVVGGLFDIDACAIGSGVVDASTFSVIAGTWNINTYPSKQAASRASGQMNSYYPNRDFLVEGSSPTSAGNLDAVLKMLMSEEIQNVKKQGKDSIYDELEVFLNNTDANFSHIIFFPFLYGSNVSADASASFLGLTTTSTKSEMIRAVYEGIVFAHKQHIDQLIVSNGKKPEVIRLSGGATNSSAWMQIFADILELPIETLEASELGGLGGAIVGLQAVNQIDLGAAIEQMVHVKTRISPDAKEAASYRRKYTVYQESLKALAPAWSALKSLREDL